MCLSADAGAAGCVRLCWNKLEKFAPTSALVTEIVPGNGCCCAAKVIQGRCGVCQVCMIEGQIYLGQ